MGSVQVIDRQQVKSVLERFEAAAGDFAALGLDALSHKDLLAVLGRVEAVKNSLAAAEHRALARLDTECAPRDLGARSMPDALASRLRISRGEAHRRIADARVLAPRTTLSGEALEPVLPTVAAGVADGVIGVEQARLVRKFFQDLPSSVDAGTRLDAERHLAQLAAQFGPEDVSAAAQHLMTVLDQELEFSDRERARKRGLTLGPQGFDKMSKLSGWVDPELRATLEAIWAKAAAPGACNRESPEPKIDDVPSQDEVDGDSRTPAQRRHDGLTTGLRALLASGKLGQHNGLPVTIVISTTLEDLESASGCAYTAGGTVLPMSDVIRLARHAHHYLSVFNKHTDVPIYLARSQRLASPGQRLVLYGSELGCTFPGCTVPAYWCEVHHVDEWRDGGHTDITRLTLACGRNHRMVKAGGWITRKTPGGPTEWIPPSELDDGQPRTNDFHHPDRLLSSDRTDEHPG